MLHACYMRHASSCNPQWPVDSVASLGIQDQLNGIQRPTKWIQRLWPCHAIHSDQSTLWPVLESKTNQMEFKDQPNGIQRLWSFLQSTVTSRLCGQSWNPRPIKWNPKTNQMQSKDCALSCNPQWPVDSIYFTLQAA